MALQVLAFAESALWALTALVGRELPAAVLAAWWMRVGQHQAACLEVRGLVVQATQALV